MNSAIIRWFKRDNKTILLFNKQMIAIGLGNPGKKYEHTRHNVGFVALGLFAEKNNLSFEEKKVFHAAIAHDGEMLYAKPTTFMNASGEAAKVLVQQYGQSLVVIYDDVYIPLGGVKCSYARGSGDHNGVQSIIDHLGHKDFFRIRVGVRPVHEELLPRIAPPDGFEKFLLSDFTSMEQELLKQGIDKTIEIIGQLKTKSFEELMNKYN